MNRVSYCLVLACLTGCAHPLAQTDLPPAPVLILLGVVALCGGARFLAWFVFDTGYTPAR